MAARMLILDLRPQPLEDWRRNTRTLWSLLEELNTVEKLYVNGTDLIMGATQFAGRLPSIEEGLLWLLQRGGERRTKLDPA